MNVIYSAASPHIRQNIHPNILDRLKMFIQTRSIPNIIFHGSSGSGKRTLLSSFINLIYGDNRGAEKDYVMYVNCAQGKGIKFIREDLKLFAKTHINTHGGNHFKSIILLNADKLTIDAQSALRRCIEVFSHTTRFFIVVEDKYKLLKPILSRFCEIYIPDPIIDGVHSNLYRHNVISMPGCAVRTKTRTAAVRRIITKLHNNTTMDSILQCSANLYSRGFSAIDVIAFFESKNVFEINAFKKHSILFHFNQMRREYRNETMTMVFIMNSFLLCSDDELENMLLM